MFVRSRRNNGASLVETMVGFIVLIPIGLAAIDVATLVTASQNNEQCAETAAKAAGRMGTQMDAMAAAQDAVNANCPLNNVVRGISVSDVDFDQAKGQVIVETTMEVKVPFPIPFFSDVMQFRANSIQPIVSTRAPI